MSRWLCIVPLVLTSSVACLGGEPDPAISAAQGTIVKIERDRIILQLPAASGKSPTRLTLAITGTSRLSAMKSSDRAGQSVITQHPMEFKDLRVQEPITVIYAADSSGAVLLSAVVRPAPVERAAGDSSPSGKFAGVPAKVATVLRYIDEHERAPEGYEGGRTFHNYGTNGEEALPRRDSRSKSISYREWDVNPKIAGRNRGPERLVTGSDGSAYFTSDHYRTFIKIR
jgi:guanyl-specific ribonuclease Sa